MWSFEKIDSTKNSETYKDIQPRSMNNYTRLAIICLQLLILEFVESYNKNKSVKISNLIDFVKKSTFDCDKSYIVKYQKTK